MKRISFTVYARNKWDEEIVLFARAVAAHRLQGARLIRSFQSKADWFRWSLEIEYERQAHG